MKEIGKIMGSDARVKVMRLFLFNDDVPFTIEDVMHHSRVSRAIARKETKTLEEAFFIKPKTFFQEVVLKTKTKKKKVQGWVLNNALPLVRPLKKLLLDPDLISTEGFPQRFKNMGSIKLLVLSGLFTGDHDRKLDVLVVGDRLNKKKIDNAVKVLESEFGADLCYAIFDTEEFNYRLKMYDQLLRDIFDYPHEKLIDKFRLSTGNASLR
jgi:hypothetical protein